MFRACYVDENKVHGAVVATVMMPLTLITSFYGMNVKAPEFEWGRFGYYFGDIGSGVSADAALF